MPILLSRKTALPNIQINYLLPFHSENDIVLKKRISNQLDNEVAQAAAGNRVSRQKRLHLCRYWCLNVRRKGIVTGAY